MLSGGEVAGLIVAVFWAILVCFLALVLVRLAQVLRSATTLVDGITEQTVPLLAEVTSTVTSANDQLVRVDAITSHVQEISANASALTSVFSATVGGPMIRAAAFTYGVRRALAERGSGVTRRRGRLEPRGGRSRARKG